MKTYRSHSPHRQDWTAKATVGRDRVVGTIKCSRNNFSKEFNVKITDGVFRVKVGSSGDNVAFKLENEECSA